MDEYLRANRTYWNERVRIHIDSSLYDVDGFKGGHVTVSDVDREEVGEVRGKTLLHLQCHFGQDTLSWARLGATVTGLDFSEEAITAAQQLADEIDVPASFVCANVYDAPQALEGRQFDVVYTAVGVICWLPDLKRWAAAAAECVKPGGVFYIREVHPLTCVFDDRPGVEELRLHYPYFHADEPMRFEEPGSYAAPYAETEHNTTYQWTHSIGDVLTSVAEAGLVIEFLHEFDHTGFKALPFMQQDGDGRWRLPEHAESVPLEFSLRARKPA